MLPERIVQLRRLADALQRSLTFTRGKTVLQSAQVACEPGPDRKNNREEQEQQGYSHARVRSRT
jgi:hypothetical protein